MSTRVKQTIWRAVGLLGVFVWSGAAMAASGKAVLLWDIGKSDNSAAEFALGPSDFAAFKEDGSYIVGYSNPKTDWPYVQPGPGDQWAGGVRIRSASCSR